MRQEVLRGYCAAPGQVYANSNDLADRPRSSAPFGNCDHNAYYGTLQQFAAEYGIPAP